MNFNRVFKKASLASVLCVAGGLALLYGCQKDVEPIYYTHETVHMVEFTVIDSETREPLSDVTILQRYPNGSRDTLSKNGVLSKNVKTYEVTDLVLDFEKLGFIPNTKTILFDIREIASCRDWSYTFQVMMTKVNIPVSVNPTEESIVEVEGSDSAFVIFPVGCVTEAVEIFITEEPAAAEVAVTSNEVELTEGRVALKCFNFLPKGQTFDVPIEITFPIPDETTLYEFAGWVDGEWKTVDVVNNGDGTGTALVSYLSDYILTTKDEWVYEESRLTDIIPFTGECDQEYVAKIEESFDSNNTVAKDDLLVRIQTSVLETKVLEQHLGYKRTVSGQYTLRYLKNVTKGYTIEIPSVPVLWLPAEESVCHNGGSGN